ncbi:lipopolysaccharide export system protein LptA [Paracoccus isoporae]|uniref:Lipopolysaccharide export system protein LptA n=1 Tax=Paracoccus isoporae TaxID=591205 RepID=A0A1G6UI72_9RHOB|nr:lipopolysaccharide transport periplasmic protein LptA [Paracoccus isoporae]SDD41013.1 lipopolysaccharide export system protein LptA [Paracoccus isoporae]
MQAALFPALALTLCLIGAAPLSAQVMGFGGGGADTDAPVELSADNLTVNRSSGEAEFSGNVIIGQGEMRLSADQVLVRYAEGDTSRIDSLQAIGNVTLVNGEDAAEANEAVYEVEAGNITLTGEVLLTQGENIMSGDSIVVNLSDGTAQASGRVRTVLQPGRD